MATTKKASTAKPLGATVSRFGRKYSKVACSTLKSDATKKADAIRAKGFSAIVVKDPVTGKNCTFQGKKLKAAVSGVKKKKATTTTRKKATTTRKSTAKKK